MMMRNMNTPKYERNIAICPLYLSFIQALCERYFIKYSSLLWLHLLCISHWFWISSFLDFVSHVLANKKIEYTSLYCNNKVKVNREIFWFDLKSHVIKLYLRDFADSQKHISAKTMLSAYRIGEMHLIFLHFVGLSVQFSVSKKNILSK